MFFPSLPQSILWQIESLWKRYFEESKPWRSGYISASTEFITKNYDKNGFSKYFKETDSHGPLRFSKKFEPQLSERIVFSDPSVGECTGLHEELLWISPDGKPVYLVDNHHFALFPFAEIGLEMGKTMPIVHIDAHRDDAVFQNPVATGRDLSLQDTIHLMEQCKVSNFLDAGKKFGLIAEIISITQTVEFETFSVPKTPFILSLDLDIFGEEGSAVPLALKVKTIAKAWNNATAIVMATSPGFMNQESALSIAKILISEKNFTFS